MRVIKNTTLPFVFTAIASAICLMAGCTTCGTFSNARPSEPATNVLLSSTNPLPFDLYGHLVIFPGIVNGQKVRLALDTGASFVMVWDKVSAETGIKAQSKARIDRYGTNESRAGFAMAGLVQVGPASVKNVPAAIVTLPGMLANSDHELMPFDGAIGLSFLKQFNFFLDYDQKLLTFYDLKGANFKGMGSEIPITALDNYLVVDANIDGIPARLEVDTGGDSGLTLHSRFIDKHKLRSAYPVKLSAHCFGIGGSQRNEIVRLKSCKLGEFTFTNEIADFEPKSKKWGDNFDGAIGFKTLRRFNILFDISGRRLWLQPNRNFTGKCAPPRSGLEYWPEGTNLVVQEVLTNSPAFEAGVRPGNRLLAINGKDYQTLSIMEVREFFRAEPGTPVILRVQTKGENPRDVTLVLRDLL